MFLICDWDLIRISRKVLSERYSGGKGAPLLGYNNNRFSVKDRLLSGCRQTDL